MRRLDRLYTLSRGLSGFETTWAHGRSNASLTAVCRAIGDWEDTIPARLPFGIDGAP